jgi:hypothetical protein
MGSKQQNVKPYKNHHYENQEHFDEHPVGNGIHRSKSSRLSTRTRLGLTARDGV